MKKFILLAAAVLVLGLAAGALVFYRQQAPGASRPGAAPSRQAREAVSVPSSARAEAPKANPILKKIVATCLDSEITGDNGQLIRESELFLARAKKKNQDWDNRYFELVSQIQDAETDYQRYTALETRLIQTQKLVSQLTTNLESVREIYKNRLKAVPTSVLLLTRIPGNMENESRKEIDTRLAGLSKQYLADEHTPVFLTANTLVKNYEVIRDVIQAVQAGRVESFESDPVRQMSPDENFYLLQKYRVYPEFAEPGAAMPRTIAPADGAFPPGFAAVVIESPDNTGIPEPFASVGDNAQKMREMFDEVNAANALGLMQIDEIERDYDAVKTDIQARLQTARATLDGVSKTLAREFPDNSAKKLEARIARAEGELNQHVESREMVLTTIVSELSQRGENLSDLYAKMVRQAYEDLMDRAGQLKSYKFFVVEDHVLTGQEARTFYKDPVPVDFSVPLRRKTYIADEGGVYRCGVLLSLTVRFASDREIGRKLEKPDADEACPEPAEPSPAKPPAPSEDLIRPSVEIRGLKPQYPKGETVLFEVRATDNQGLAVVRFQVAGTSIREEWEASGPEAVQRSAFDTAFLAPGAYAFSVEAMDRAGNTATLNGGFTISDKAPETPNLRDFLSGE